MIGPPRQATTVREDFMIVSTPAAASLELKHELKAEARTWLAKAREFAEEVVRPLGKVLDRMDAAGAVALDSPLRDFLAQAHREGYTRLSDSQQRGGVGLSAAAEYLVLEELASADAGLAVLLCAAPLPFRWAGAGCFGRLARDLSLPYFRGERIDWIGCCAAAEDTRLRASATAGGWLLRGRTGWVPGAAIATHAAIACVVGAGSADGCALAIVPLERAGVSRSPALDRLGLRSEACAKLTLEGVEMSRDELLLSPRAGFGLLGSAAVFDHVVGAIAAAGIARAAYDGALRLLREGARHGTAPAELGGARRRLFRMFTLLEATRALTRAAHLYASEGSGRDDGLLQHATAAHGFAIEAAQEIVDGAMALCAHRADARGVVEYLDGSTFQPEKLLRDARCANVAWPASASLPLDAIYP